MHTQGMGDTVKCALCEGSFAPEDVDVVDERVTVCHDCLDRAGDPGDPLPWELGWMSEDDVISAEAFA